MYKVLMMPINLLSNTILDVFKQKATEDYNKYGNCKDIFLNTFKKLVILGILPFSVLGIFAPDIFVFVFGENWRISGEFAQIMAPVLFLKFITSPLSYTFHIRQKQQLNLIGQIVLLLVTLLSVYLGVIFKNEYMMILFFSISYSIVYIIYIFVSYKLSKGISHI
jgi:O-antigen/teichoic acid export membrane protein